MICQEFFRKTWGTSIYDILAIMNHMYIDGIVTDQQKRGIIVFLTKTSNPKKIEDYRRLTLLNTDYKLLTRIIANRLRPWLAGILQKSQHCGLQANMVLEPATAVRDAVTYAELTGSLLCIL